MSRWVRSKYSEEATKWEVLDETENFWLVCNMVPSGSRDCIDLPKSEYIECPAPARWEVCTREVATIHQCSEVLEVRAPQRLVKECRIQDDLYRWAFSKIDPNALIIERKVEE